MRHLLLAFLFAFGYQFANAQGLSYNCTRFEQLGCSSSCLTLTTTIPDVRVSTADYVIGDVSGVAACYPLVDPGGPGPEVSLTVDDRYSSSVAIGFGFPFYGTNYNNLVVSTNGYVSFNTALANTFSHWDDYDNLPSTEYDEGLIMGPYHDLNPNTTNSPNKKAKYNVIGTAPTRKWVLSFYKMPLFDCTTLFENTHQIILHESSGIIEVYIVDKQICNTWNSGRAMVGIQNYQRNKGLMAPGRRMFDAPWGSIGMNEMHRFVPASGASAFRGSQVIEANSGTVLYTSTDTVRSGNSLTISFGDVCPPINTITTYLIKTEWQSAFDPAVTYFSVDTVIVERKDKLPMDLSSTPTQCGQSTGSITAVAFGGVEPYEYSIDGGNTYQPSGLFPNLAQGTYTVIGIDALGCSDTLTIDVDVIANIPGTATATATGCPGVNNGTITVTPQGGTAPYTYSVDGGTPVNTNVITGVGAGTHTVIFTDANGCTGSVTVTVGAGASLTLTTSPISTSCPAANNGSVTVTPTSGAGPYEYSLDNGATWQSSNVFTGLASGNYTVTVRDASGCTGTRNFFVSNGSGVIGSISSQPASCAGIDNGTITVNVVNGVAPFSFTLDGGTPQASNVFTNVSAGAHTVVVTDNVGCSRSFPVNVTQGNGITGSGTATNTACPGVDNGSITLTANSGVAPYEYSIDGGTTWHSNNVFNGLGVGTYQAVIRDANGCRFEVSLTVNAGTTITATSTSSPAACASASDGSATVTPTNGSAPYQYSIDGGTTWQSSATFEDLAPGTYTIMVEDQSGCQGTVSVTVTAGTGFTATATTNPAACSGAPTGSIAVSTTGGAAPFEYSIDGGTTWQTSNEFNNIVDATYTIDVRDANGCTFTLTATVTAGSSYTVSTTTTPAACSGSATGSITVTTTGGVAPFEYSIDGGTTWQTSSTFNNIPDGTHTITVRDANGCTATTTATVDAGNTYTGTYTSTPTACSGVATGTVTVTPTGGAAPYEFSIDNGTTWQASSTITNLAEGTHHILIRDANGCIGELDADVTAGTALTGTATHNQATCTTAPNGTITVTPTSGVAPYEYSIDGGTTWQTNDEFTGLIPDTYTIIIRDQVGCTGTVTETVTPGTGLDGTVDQTPTSCAGVNNGTITVTVNTAIGAAPYQYALDGGATQAAATFTGVSAGVHQVQIIDANGCTVDLSITVGEGNGFTADATPYDAACPGVDNGSVTITPTGGTAPFTYALNGGAAQNSDTFNGLATGTHSVVVTDANGCTATVNFTIGQGNGIVATSDPTPTACPNATTGSVTITPNNGTAPYQYALNGGTSQSSNVFTGLAAGTYTVDINDAMGCTGTITVTIVDGPLITGSATSTPTSCPGVANGSIEVTADAPSVAPYQYSIDGGTTWQASNIFNNIAEGTHQVIIRDANGCITNPIAVTVGTGAPITGVIEGTNTTCPGVNNGTVTLTSATGTGPYTYSLDGGPAQASNTFTNLAPGTYTITFTDANGCSGTASTTIGTGTGLDGTADAVATSCPGVNNGSVTVNMTNGTAPYQYSINGGAAQASNVFTNLAPGTYTITVTDAIGCTGDVTATVTEGSNLTSDVTPTNPNCADINDGIIVVTPTTGTAPYQYVLDGGTPQASNTFSNLAPGTYNISFTDAIGCSGTNTVTLTTNPPIVLTGSSTDPLCFGSSDGTITIQATGGVAPYNYSINNGTTYQSNNDFTQLSQGNYTIIVKDNVNCTKEINIDLVQPDALIATATALAPSTCAGNDGSIEVTGNGGTAPYTYSIDNGGNFPFQSSGLFNTVATGNYTNITVKDNNGCLATAAAVFVDEIDNMFLTIGADTTICEGSSVTFQPQTNDETSVFTWTPSTGLQDPNIKFAVASPVDTTTYTLTAQWGACSRTVSTTVNVKWKPIPDAGDDVRICLNDSTMIHGSVSHTSGPVTLTWEPADLVHDPNATSTWAVPNGTQWYVLVAQDQYGCDFTVRDSVLVIMQPEVPAYAGGDTLLVMNQEQMLLGYGGVEYLWSTPSSGVQIINPTAQNPTVILQNDARFFLKVIDIAGCVGYDTVYVQVYAGPDYYVPNAFTPNGDGLNDVFRAIPVGMTRPEFFRVYNRYGQVVFETNQYMKGWDGTFKGKMQQPGTYVWVVRGKDKNGRTVELKGTVLLIL